MVKGKSSFKQERLPRLINRGSFAWAHTLVVLVSISLLIVLMNPAHADDAVNRSTGLKCDSNTIYALTSRGRIYDTTTGTEITRISDVSGSRADALAISPNGERAYAVWRKALSSHEFYVYEYGSPWDDVEKFSTGLGNPTPHMGAVNPKTGEYVMGYTSDRNTVQLLAFDPRTKKVRNIGQVQTNEIPYLAVNDADLAFTPDGTLHIMRSWGLAPTQVVVTTIPAATIANSTGDDPSRQLQAVIGPPFKVDLAGPPGGLAFGSDGYLYMAGSSNMVKYTVFGAKEDAEFKMPGRTTNLASCNSPSTIALEKDVRGRATDTDQFTLQLEASSLQYQTTTTGKNNGVQTERLGAYPVPKGEYQFSETISPETSTLNYTTGWVCRDSNGETSQGVGFPAQLEIQRDGLSPGPRQDVTCTITNGGPITLTIGKTVLDENGEPDSELSGWEFTATFDKIKPDSIPPKESSQTTESDGKVAWTALLDTVHVPATITVDEEIPAGSDYQIDEFTCTVTDPLGEKPEYDLTKQNPRVISDVDSGSTVECQVTNRKIVGEISVKAVDGLYDGQGQVPLENISFELWKDVNGDGVITDDDQKVGELTSADGSVNWNRLDYGSYCVQQQTTLDGYDKPEPQCVTLTKDNKTESVTFVNIRKTGTVIWSLVDDMTPGRPLSGSTWTLTGPQEDDSQSITITDCVSNDPQGCASDLDTNPSAGTLTVTGLKWGTYTLVETQAPAGFIRSETPIEFTITATDLEHTISPPIPHEKAPAIPLPLTGSMGSQIFFMSGGALLLIALMSALITIGKRT